jgi:hypothetical protein
MYFVKMVRNHGYFSVKFCSEAENKSAFPEIKKILRKNI